MIAGPANGKPLVSVVMACRDGVSTVEAAVRSALDQTLADIEVIVFDDASRDRSADLVQAMVKADPRIRPIRSADCVGAARARNLAAFEAKGMFIAALDADDLWHPKYLSDLVAALRRSPEAGFAYCPHRLIDWDDRVLYSFPSYACEGRVLARQAYVNIVGAGSALVMRREAFDRAGGYDEDAWSHGGGEDLMLQMRISSFAPVAFAPRHLVGYRVGLASHSANRARSFAARIHALDKIKQEFPGIPASALRWSRADAHLDAAYHAIKWGSPGQAAAYFARGALMDPRGASAFLAIVIRAILHKAANGRELAERPSFRDVDPSDAMDAVVAPLAARRLGRLAAADANPTDRLNQT